MFNFYRFKIRYFPIQLFFATNLFCMTSFADIGIVNFKISANIVKTTCVVDANSLNKAVQLGTWNSKSLSSNGTKPVLFDLVLLDCPTNVILQFEGDQDPTNNELYSLDTTSTAKNIAIAILDVNNNRIPPKTNNQGKPLNGSDDKRLTFRFYGQYLPTNTPITGGSANADVTFNLIYE